MKATEEVCGETVRDSWNVLAPKSMGTKVTLTKVPKQPKGWKTFLCTAERLQVSPTLGENKGAFVESKFDQQNYWITVTRQVDSGYNRFHQSAQIFKTITSWRKGSIAFLNQERRKTPTLVTSVQQLKKELEKLVFGDGGTVGDLRYNLTLRNNFMIQFAQ